MNKKLLCALQVVFILLTLPYLPVEAILDEGEIIYQTDFEDGATDWNINDGDWKIEETVGNKVLNQTNTSRACYAIYNAPNNSGNAWNNYSVEVTIKVNSVRDGTNSFSVRTGYQATQGYNNNYAFQYNDPGSAPVFRIMQYNNGTGTTLASVAAQNAEVGSEYTFKAMWYNGKLEFWVDNVKILEAADELFTAGRIALNTNGPSVQFDDVVVREIIGSNEPFIPPEDAVLVDDFESQNANRWDTYGGTWAVKANGSNYLYEQSQNEESWAFHKDSELEDYSVQCDVSAKDIVPSTEQTIGICTGAENNEPDKNNYSFQYQNNADGSSMHQIVKYQNGVKTILASQAATPIEKDKTYRLKGYMYRDGTLEFHVNGILRVTTNDKSFKKGKIGLMSDNASAWYDNVAITPGNSIMEPEIRDISGDLLFSTFESDDDTSWTTSGGTWSKGQSSLHGGSTVYKQTNTASATNFSFAGDYSWSDYALECTASIIALGSAGHYLDLCVGVQETVSYANNYAFQYTDIDGTPVYRIQKYSSQGNTILASAVAPSALEKRTYQMKAVMYKGELEFWLNGVLVLKTEDTSFRSGRIGLRNNGINVEYDNISVTPLNKRYTVSPITLVDALPGVQLTLNFDSPMSPNTVNSSHITITNTENQVQVDPAKVSITAIDSSNQVYRVSIEDWLEFQTKYQIYASELVLASDGNYIPGRLREVYFTTKETPLPVSSRGLQCTQKGTPITNLASLQGTVNVTATLICNTAQATNVTIIAALCDGSGKSYAVKSLITQDVTIPGDAKPHDITLPLTLPEGMTKPFIKVFFWDRLTGATRLTEALTY